MIIFMNYKSHGREDFYDSMYYIWSINTYVIILTFRINMEFCCCFHFVFCIYPSNFSDTVSF